MWRVQTAGVSTLLLLGVMPQLLVPFPSVVGDYELKVRAHSYSNPTHRHYGGGCCDNLLFCHNQCDNYFIFCLRPSGYSHRTISCPLGERHTGEVQGGDSLSFGNRMGNQPNPLLFSNSGNWPGSFQLLVDIYDHDDFFGSLIGGDEFVDSIFIETDLQPSESFTRPQSYTGTYRRGTISLSFQVACTGNYYGPSCALFCEPNNRYTCDRNGSIVCRANRYGSQCTTICESNDRYLCDQRGNRTCRENYYGLPECRTLCVPTNRYTCDSAGERICRMNYFNPPDCTTFCMPRNDTEGHYSCDEDGNIRCLSNYYGPQCTVFCEPQDNQYSCSNDGERLCEERYYGPLCDVFCMGRNDSLGHYQCSENGSIVCLEGYQGTSSNCTRQLCEPECSSAGGYCNGSGLCHCYAGWRGQQCDECIPNMGCSAVGGYCLQPEECLCQEGYTGALCQTVLDVCSQSDLCENGGSCNNDGVGGYRCLCPDGYTGANCDTDIDECNSAANPCLNSGQCINQVGSFSCECLERFTGSLCEETISIPSTPPEGTPESSGSSSELPNTVTTAAVIFVGNGGDSGESTTNIGLTLGVLFAVLLLVSIAAAIVVVVVLLLRRTKRGRWKKADVVMLLTEEGTELERPRNLSMENPTYLPSTMGHHAVEPSSLTSAQEYNMYNPLYEINTDPVHYESFGRDSRASEHTYSTIDHREGMNGPRQLMRIPSSSSQAPLVSNEGYDYVSMDYTTEYVRDDSSR